MIIRSIKVTGIKYEQKNAVYKVTKQSEYFVVMLNYGNQNSWLRDIWNLFYTVVGVLRYFNQRLNLNHSYSGNIKE